MQFDFYRAYSAATATRSAKALDAAGNVMLGDDGRPFKAPVAEWPVEDVAFEGDADENRAVFDAGDTVITRVVFYIGDAESARKSLATFSPEAALPEEKTLAEELARKLAPAN